MLAGYTNRGDPLIIDTDTIQPAHPRGRCFCGCGDQTAPTKFFANTHDHPALSAVVREVYGDTATFLLMHGYGPDVARSAPIAGDGLPLRIGDRIEGDIRTGHVVGTLTKIRKKHIVLLEDGTGGERSAIESKGDIQFPNFRHL